ncbi:hypothetical protein GQ55_3G188100 [Panicum hallii var. hallii]|uniref:Uncharacterized protein n=1 Tax=Panicum hallii var. hallii TaxID=1504633 RepID=A0A2T7EAY8_9POAL|nr:hypothetical protein GQ55_3G188100 [Panicum hallii var. hallii]
MRQTLDLHSDSGGGVPIQSTRTHPMRLLGRIRLLLVSSFASWLSESRFRSSPSPSSPPYCCSGLGWCVLLLAS